MKPILLIALLTLSVSACTGADGPAGPTGPTGPRGDTGPGFDRSKLYCNTLAGVGTTTNWTVIAECNNVSDFPVSGDCYISGAEAPGYRESFSGPSNWSDLTRRAGWTCTWAPEPGATTVVQIGSATAEICCATNP